MTVMTISNNVGPSALTRAQIDTMLEVLKEHQLRDHPHAHPCTCGRWYEDRTGFDAHLHHLAVGALELLARDQAGSR